MNADETGMGVGRAGFRIYKAMISPLLHAVGMGQCLYLPTCSEYVYTAVSRFGVLRGSWMALGRLARCNPWGRGGLDPVPERGGANAGSRGSADRLP